ncbi:hypothetical protein EVAR_31938_1 [Eumeta japonica]|uniref:Uncharacterized protein n=1 Tax=Eumeta variegata TaxID=151549 RepID=A0A4C1WS52_EUMVA|nr:hypothetical protein EVAR_31938_1 [Eumeta japonica]
MARSRPGCGLGMVYRMVLEAVPREKKILYTDADIPKGCRRPSAPMIQSDPDVQIRTLAFAEPASMTRTGARGRRRNRGSRDNVTGMKPPPLKIYSDTREPRRRTDFEISLLTDLRSHFWGVEPQKEPFQNDFVVHLSVG